ncbi:hypothetical protein ACLK1T_07085 [Escherichia coli]
MAKPLAAVQLVMLGGMLAGHEEDGGRIVEENRREISAVPA